MAANDKVNKAKGGPQDDSVPGTDDNDVVDGKSGSDSVDGTAGSDWVKGGSGDDLLTYGVSENDSSENLYDAGAGADELLLAMTFDEWMRLDIQDDIARYLPWLVAHTNDDGFTTGHSFSFAAFSLQARKVEALRVTVDGVELNPEDEAVTLADDALSTDEDQQSVGGNVLTNDDVPDLVRSVELVQGPAVGAVDIATSGDFTYSFDEAFHYLSLGQSLDMEFVYRVTDADMDAETATVTITVIGVNDAPVAVADLATVDEDSDVVVDVVANDSDIDQADTFAVTSVEQPTVGGIATIVDGSIEFASNGDFETLAVGESTDVAFGYQITDDKGATADSTVTVTVTGVNDAPIAADDAVTAEEDEAVMIAALYNDTDIDVSDTHTIDWVTLDDDGRAGASSAPGPAVTVSNNMISFNPGSAYDYLAVGEEVTATMTYEMSDNHAATDTAKATVRVIGTNDAPVALGDEVTLDEDDTITIDALANDYDPDASDSISIAAYSQPDMGKVVESNGQLVFDTDGDFNYLAAGDIETTRFTYTIADDYDTQDTAVVDVIVVGENDAPVARMDDAETTESGTVLIDVLRNDSDVDQDDELTVSSVSVVYGDGKASISNGQILFDTNGEFENLGVGQTREAIIEYTIKDKLGATATSAAFVTISGEYDAPSLIETLDGYDFGAMSVDYASDWHTLRFDEQGEYTTLTFGGAAPANGYSSEWEMGFNNASLFGIDADPAGLREEVSGGFSLDSGSVNLIDIDALWDDAGTGAEFTAGFEAEFGVDFTPFVAVEGGTMGSEQGVRAGILSANTDSDGYYSLNTNALASPWSEVNFDFPDAYNTGIDVAVNAMLRFYANAKGEFLGADVFDWSADQKLLDAEAEFNLITAGVDTVEGGLSLSLLGADPFVYTKDIALPKGIGQIKFYDESHDDESSASFLLSTLSSGSQSITGIRFDFDDILGNLPKVGVVFANLDNKKTIGIAGVGGVELDYTFLGAGFSFDLDLAAQTVSTPEFTADLVFDRPVYVEGFADPVMALRNADWGNLPGIKSVDGSAVKVTPYFNSQYELGSSLGINLVGTFDYKIGEIGARVYVTDIFDESLNLGPLLSGEAEVFDIELIGINDISYASTGYDQFGGGSFMLG